MMASMPPFLDLTIEFASKRQYSDIYNCANFTKEQIAMLKENGYDAHAICGTRNGTLHAWVAVEFEKEEYWVEATTGRLVDTDARTGHYSEIRLCDDWNFMDGV